MQFKKLYLAALAAAAVSGTAIGQGIPPPGGSVKEDKPASSASSGGTEFTKLDKDSDGKVSKKEAKSNKDLTAKWNTLDTNKDGNLDQAEFARFEAAPSLDLMGK